MITNIWQGIRVTCIPSAARCSACAICVQCQVATAEDDSASNQMMDDDGNRYAHTFFSSLEYILLNGSENLSIYISFFCVCVESWYALKWNVESNAENCKRVRTAKIAKRSDHCWKWDTYVFQQQQITSSARRRRRKKRAEKKNGPKG